MKNVIVLLGSFALLAAPVLVAADNNEVEIAQVKQRGSKKQKRQRKEKMHFAKRSIRKGNKRGKQQQEGMWKRGLSKAKSMLGFGVPAVRNKKHEHNDKSRKQCKAKVKCSSEKGKGRRAVGMGKARGRSVNNDDERPARKSRVAKAHKVKKNRAAKKHGKRGRRGSKKDLKEQEAEAMQAIQPAASDDL
ncbi:hypothetical protein FJ365_04060 [Candidatus Dependentiae bacterium]|nr:hypothetical protein [Candidatus Dependentiae bacterium]